MTSESDGDVGCTQGDIQTVHGAPYFAFVACKREQRGVFCRTAPWQQWFGDSVPLPSKPIVTYFGHKHMTQTLE